MSFDVADESAARAFLESFCRERNVGDAAWTVGTKTIVHPLQGYTPFVDLNTSPTLPPVLYRKVRYAHSVIESWGGGAQEIEFKRYPSLYGPNNDIYITSNLPFRPEEFPVGVNEFFEFTDTTMRYQGITDIFGIRGRISIELTEPVQFSTVIGQMVSGLSVASYPTIAQSFEETPDGFQVTLNLGSISPVYHLYPAGAPTVVTSYPHPVTPLGRGASFISENLGQIEFVVSAPTAPGGAVTIGPNLGIHALRSFQSSRRFQLVDFRGAVERNQYVISRHFSPAGNTINWQELSCSRLPGNPFTPGFYEVKASEIVDPFGQGFYPDQFSRHFIQVHFPVERSQWQIDPITSERIAGQRPPEIPSPPTTC